MVPPKSSIGEISSKISSNPEIGGSPFASTRACQRSLPSNQSKLSTCSPSRSGAASGSWIRANETRSEERRVGNERECQGRRRRPRAEQENRHPIEIED